MRLGSASAIVGVVTLLVATFMHPMHADPDDAAAAFAEYAADRWWIASHLAAFLGVALMTGALYGLARSLESGSGAGIAGLACLVAFAALALGAALQAVDGVALKAMVDRWASAAPAQKQAAFEAALAVRHIEIGLASYIALLFGAAIVLFGRALVVDARHPVWLGWLGILAGIGTGLGGVLTAFTGFTDLAMMVGMPSNLAMLAWVMLVGFFMWRHAS